MPASIGNASPALRRLVFRAYGPRRRVVAVRLVLACALTCLLSFSGTARALADQGQTLLSLIGQMESSYARVEDFTAEFRKKERFKNKPLPEERIMVKFRKPLNIYMKWLDGPAKEAMYVDGKYDNKVLARCDGLLGFMTWSFNPNDPVLMTDNLHPITELGFGFIIQMMRRDIPEALAKGEIQIVRMEEEQFFGRPATAIELKFTPKDGRKYYAAHTVFHVDKEYLLPVGVVCYDETETMFEQYSYLDVKLNAGLSEQDFTKGNKAYRF